MAEPYCLAMVLCDSVYRDSTTGKCTILGTFSAFQASSFPSSLRFCIYFAVTDGIGPARFKIRLVHSDSLLDESDEAIEFTLPEVQIESPLAVNESFVLIQTVLNRPGQYHCELYVNDEPLMTRKLLVLGPDDQESKE